MYGTSMIIGVVAIIVEATAVFVYWIAISESETPTKGPNIEPANVALTAFRFLKPSLKSLNRLVKSIISANPIIPVMIRI